MFNRAKVFVSITHDLNVEVELGVARMRTNLKKYFNEEFRTLSDQAEKKIMPETFIEELIRFNDANTWKFWIVSQGLDYFVSLDYLPSESEQRYLMDLFSFVGGYKIEITQTGSTKDYTDAKGRPSRLIARARPQVKQFFVDE